MSPRQRLIGVLIVVASLGIGTWYVFPGPFVRGALVGALVALGAVLGAATVAVRTVKKRMGGKLTPPPLPVERWDYAMALTDLDGAEADLSGAKGKVLVLNFWATWCAPCVAELPSLRALMDATADLDVRFAFVTKEDPPVVRRFAEARSLNLPIYLLAGDAPSCFQSRAVPATFILGKEGRIAMRHVGAAAWDDEAVVTFVRGLAAKPG